MKPQLFNIESFTADYDDPLVDRVKTFVTKGENERRLLCHIGAGAGQLLVKLASALDDTCLTFVKVFQPGDLEEKLTPAEVKQIVSSSLPHGGATITAPTDGPASLGFELLIRKAGDGASAPQPMQRQV